MWARGGRGTGGNPGDALPARWPAVHAVRLAAAIKAGSGQGRALMRAGCGRRCGCHASLGVSALRRVLKLTIRWGAEQACVWQRPLEMATRLYAWPCALEPGHAVSHSDRPGRDAGVITSGATPRLARTRVARPHHAHAGCSGIMRGQALVAQPDRVVASEAIGRGFESLRAHQFSSRARAGIKKPSRDRGFFVACTAEGPPGSIGIQADRA